MSEKLKGGISYNKYIWKTSEGACEACSALNNTIYEYEGDIPDRPHPNCKCHVEQVQEEEPCDCWEEIDAILDEADELEGNLNSMIDEILELKREIESDLVKFQILFNEVKNEKAELEQNEPCGANCAAITGMAVNISDGFDIKTYSLVFDYGYETIIIIEGFINACRIFLENKSEMTETKNAHDKYYHAKANCEAAELGAIEALFAVLLSIYKELCDIPEKIFKKKMKFDEALNDSIRDLQADLYGLRQAKKHGYCSDKVKNVDSIFKN